jgi:hypothetical protein
MTASSVNVSVFRKTMTMRLGKLKRAVFLGFGFVSAQLQGLTNLRLRQSLAKTQKSSLRIGHSFSSNALKHRHTSGFKWRF